jgi:hypothetical protein
MLHGVKSNQREAEYSIESASSLYAEQIQRAWADWNILCPAPVSVTIFPLIEVSAVSNIAAPHRTFGVRNIVGWSKSVDFYDVVACSCASIESESTADLKSGPRSDRTTSECATFAFGLEGGQSWRRIVLFLDLFVQILEEMPRAQLLP